MTKMNEKYVEGLMKFIDSSPSAYHVIENVYQELENNGFTELKETEHWELKNGEKYYVTRNASSLIAFQMPKEPLRGFQIAAAHSDSPCFKLKENTEFEQEGEYSKLNVEKYGGMIMSTWFDRPLSIAGRILIQQGDGFEQRLVNIDEDICVIPNVAIHMNREANEGMKYNAQTDLLPVLGGPESKGELYEFLASEAGIEKEQILSHDLFLYSRQKSSRTGMKKEWITAPRLDDLQCVYSILQGFIMTEKISTCPVMAIFDNEEVGSVTKQGAVSTFLRDVCMRITDSCLDDREAYYRVIANSFLMSADNAHALHPNHAEKADPINRPYMNKGIVLKYHAGQKYTTDAVSAAYVKMLCKKVQVPYQIFTNRSDMNGGSTLGNLSNQQISVNAADIGLAQLAMHSACETAGCQDTEYMIKLMKEYFESEFIK